MDTAKGQLDLIPPDAMESERNTFDQDVAATGSAMPDATTKELPEYESGISDDLCASNQLKPREEHQSREITPAPVPLATGATGQSKRKIYPVPVYRWL